MGDTLKILAAIVLCIIFPPLIIVFLIVLICRK